MFPFVQPSWFSGISCEHTLYFFFFFTFIPLLGLLLLWECWILFPFPIESVKVLSVLIDLLSSPHPLWNFSWPPPAFPARLCFSHLCSYLWCCTLSVDRALLKGAPLFPSVERWWATARVLPSWPCPSSASVTICLDLLADHQAGDLLDPVLQRLVVSKVHVSWGPASRLISLTDPWSCFLEVELYFLGMAHQLNLEGDKYAFDLLWPVISSYCDLSSPLFPVFCPTVCLATDMVTCNICIACNPKRLG